MQRLAAKRVALVSGRSARVSMTRKLRMGAAMRQRRSDPPAGIESCAGSSPPGKSRTSRPREALLLSEPVLVETASVLSSGSIRPAAYTADRASYNSTLGVRDD